MKKLFKSLSLILMFAFTLSLACADDEMDSLKQTLSTAEKLELDTSYEVTNGFYYTFTVDETAFYKLNVSVSDIDDYYCYLYTLSDDGLVEISSFTSGIIKLYSNTTYYWKDEYYGYDDAKMTFKINKLSLTTIENNEEFVFESNKIYEFTPEKSALYNLSTGSAVNLTIYQERNGILSTVTSRNESDSDLFYELISGETYYYGLRYNVEYSDNCTAKLSEVATKDLKLNESYVSDGSEVLKFTAEEAGLYVFETTGKGKTVATSINSDYNSYNKTEGYNNCLAKYINAGENYYLKVSFKDSNITECNVKIYAVDSNLIQADTSYTVNGSAIYKFVPEKTGIYYLNAEDCTTNNVFESVYDLLWNNSYDGNTFTAGKTYYIKTVLSNEVTRDYEFKIASENVENIEQGITYSGTNHAIYSFTPTEDGVYQFKASGVDSFDTELSLIVDDDFNILASECGYKYSPAVLICNLTAGNTYYYNLYYNDENNSNYEFTLKVTKVENIELNKTYEISQSEIFEYTPTETGVYLFTADSFASNSVYLYALGDDVRYNKIEAPGNEPYVYVLSAGKTYCYEAKLSSSTYGTLKVSINKVDIKDAAIEEGTLYNVTSTSAYKFKPATSGFYSFKDYKDSNFRVSLLETTDDSCSKLGSFYAVNSTKLIYLSADNDYYIVLEQIQEDDDTESTDEYYDTDFEIRLNSIKSIEQDEVYTVSPDTVYKFIPEQNNQYIIEMDSEETCHIYLYEVDYDLNTIRLVSSKYDSEIAKLTKGTTYYLVAHETTNAKFQLYSATKNLITEGETYNNDNEKIFVFQPLEDGVYNFEVSGKINSELYIYSNVFEYYDEFNYCEEGNNYSISCELTGGHTYYIKSKIYDYDKTNSSYIYTGSINISVNKDIVASCKHKLVKLSAVAATCTTTGLTEGKKCSVCGTITVAQKKVAAKGHSYTSKVTKPTYTAKGYTTYTCSRCGDSYKSNYTNMLTLTKPTVKVANTSTGVQVTWSKTTGATGYIVYRKTAKGTFTAIKTITSGSTVSYTDTSAKAGTTYYYTVRAYAGSTTTNKSSYVTDVSIKYLDQPTVTLTNTSAGVKISWTESAGASGYYVYRKAPGDKKWTLINKASNLSYTDTTAKAGTTYYYTVKAYSGKTYSSYVTDKTIKHLAQPTVTLTNTSAGVKISWTESAGAGGYYVYRKAPGDKKWTLINKASNLSYTDTAAKAGTTYYYTVKAYSGKTYSSYVTDKIIKRLTQPVVTLSNVTKGVKISWKKITGASGYIVYRKTASGKWEVLKKLTSASILSYTDTTGKNGTTYYYTVKAYSGNINSSYVTNKSIKYKK
jgi:fibronectin type 3 domain-containing protein